MCIRDSRDIYPQEFYDRITGRNLCAAGPRVLDVGTGTGVLPRHMYRYGARWTGTDLSENQIAQARLLSEGTEIEYRTVPAEEAVYKRQCIRCIRREEYEFIYS